MQSNENKKSTSNTNEGQKQSEGSELLASEKEPEVIEKKKTSIQFQENKPQVEKATSQNIEPENDDTEGEDNENQNGKLEVFKDPSQAKEVDISEVNEDDVPEDQENELSGTATGDDAAETGTQQIPVNDADDNEDEQVSFQTTEVDEADEKEPSSQTAEVDEADEEEPSSQTAEVDEADEKEPSSQTAEVDEADEEEPSSQTAEVDEADEEEPSSQTAEADEADEEEPSSQTAEVDEADEEEPSSQTAEVDEADEEEPSSQTAEVDEADEEEHSSQTAEVDEADEEEPSSQTAEVDEADEEEPSSQTAELDEADEEEPSSQTAEVDEADEEEPSSQTAEVDEADEEDPSSQTAEVDEDDEEEPSSQTAEVDEADEEEPSSQTAEVDEADEEEPSSQTAEVDEADEEEPSSQTAEVDEGDEEEPSSQTAEVDEADEEEPSFQTAEDEEPKGQEKQFDENTVDPSTASLSLSIVSQAIEKASIQYEEGEILPSISSADIVVDEEPVTDQPTADYAFSQFSSVLQEEEKHRSTEEALIPLDHQDFQFTVLQTEEDIKEHFLKKPVKKPSTKLHSKSSLKLGPKPSTRLSRLRPPELKEDVLKKESPSKLITTGEAPTTSELCSEWVPGKEEPKVGYYYRYRSWVGDYILGYDYWSQKKDEDGEERVNEVRFNIDDGHRWYDMKMSDSKISKSAMDKKRDVTMKKIEAVKVKAPVEVGKGVSEKTLPLAYNPKEPVDEHLKGDLKDMFMEFAKNDTSTVKNRMSLKNADKWLERVGLLDHKHLTLVHTGLCFRASGGSRYRGLTFEEFFTFVEMISDTRNMPLQHSINRLKYAVLDITIAERMQ